MARRGRKPKKKPDNPVPSVPKKRGRKPKGGKIVSKIEEPTTNHILTNNVILHLKCSLLFNTSIFFRIIYAFTTSLVGTDTFDNARVNDIIGPSMTFGSANIRKIICTPTRPWIED